MTSKSLEASPIRSTLDTLIKIELPRAVGIEKSRWRSGDSTAIGEDDDPAEN